MAAEYHQWLRDMLADKGLMARDVAAAWDGVNQSVVSRFISKGEPALTWRRAEALCRMLGLSMTELQERITAAEQRAASRVVAFKPEPETVPEPAPPEEPHVAEQAPPVAATNGNGAKRALEKLQACAEECMRSLPKGFQVSVQIFYTGAS